MSRNKKILIGAGIVLVLAAVVFANIKFKRQEGLAVNVEAVQKRDLQAIVSASGKIQPQRLVNISADTMGRVVDLKVEEGQRVKKGDFLLQIDPRNLTSAYNQTSASLAASRSTIEQLRVSLEGTKTSLKQAQENLARQQSLFKAGLTPKESLDNAENQVKMRESEVSSQERQIETQKLRMQQEQATVENAKLNLSKVRIESPLTGIITRRNIEEGETVVIGTMNNAGTVLLTVADMSVIEAEVEVDETDIPLVQMGQKAKVTIDAIPDKTFTGTVTEIGNSPIQAAGTGTTRTATNFKVVVTIDGQIPDVRPGFTCTAEITTATRQTAVAVPIQSLTVRELIYDAQGNVINEPRPAKKGFQFGPAAATPTPAAAGRELKPGEKREEAEGVFLLKDNKATFVKVKVGIAGERYLEVLSGLKEGDMVITGPFESVRTLYEGDLVRTAAPPKPQ